jgi:hypothetical protein
MKIANEYSVVESAKGFSVVAKDGTIIVPVTPGNLEFPCKADLETGEILFVQEPYPYTFLKLNKAPLKKIAPVTPFWITEFKEQIIVQIEKYSGNLTVDKNKSSEICIYNFKTKKLKKCDHKFQNCSVILDGKKKAYLVVQRTEEIEISEHGAVLYGGYGLLDLDFNEILPTQYEQIRLEKRGGKSVAEISEFSKAKGETTKKYMDLDRPGVFVKSDARQETGTSPQEILNAAADAKESLFDRPTDKGAICLLAEDLQAIGSLLNEFPEGNFKYESTELGSEGQADYEVLKTPKVKFLSINCLYDSVTYFICIESKLKLSVGLVFFALEGDALKPLKKSSKKAVSQFQNVLMQLTLFID